MYKSTPPSGGSVVRYGGGMCVADVVLTRFDLATYRGWRGCDKKLLCSRQLFVIPQGYAPSGGRFAPVGGWLMDQRQARYVSHALTWPQRHAVGTLGPPWGVFGARWNHGVSCLRLLTCAQPQGAADVGPATRQPETNVHQVGIHSDLKIRRTDRWF